MQAPELPAFAFTMNFGQLLQVVSIVVPFLIFLVKYGAAHATLVQRVSHNAKEMIEVKDELRGLRDEVRSLTPLLMKMNRQNRPAHPPANQGHSLWDKAFEYPPDGLLPDELKKVGELIADMRANKNEG